MQTYLNSKMKDGFRKSGQINNGLSVKVNNFALNEGEETPTPDQVFQRTLFLKNVELDNKLQSDAISSQNNSKGQGGDQFENSDIDSDSSGYEVSSPDEDEIMSSIARRSNMANMEELKE